MKKEAIAAHFRRLQVQICTALEQIDGSGRFAATVWRRPGGGGGRSCSLQQGHIIEKGGVNASAVYGKPAEVLRDAFHLQEDRFYATGLSIVLHPWNPYIPIIHMNMRYFELSGGRSWFGGGIDLTPHYIDRAEAAAFHRGLQQLCEAHAEVADYGRFKAAADDYFYLPHRKETRGIGGIFFDRMQEGAMSQRWAFVKAIGAAFLDLYRPIIQAHKDKSYGKSARSWQLLRRGRYVEFNLLYDVGTKFGLQSHGRTESIFMSLPPQAQWYSSPAPKPQSPEATTQQGLRKGIDWTKSV